MKVTSNTKSPYALFHSRHQPNLTAQPARRRLVRLGEHAPRWQAQNSVLAGTIAGRVTDPSGASVPEASLVVRNLATGLQQTTVTNHAGTLPVPGTHARNLVPGHGDRKRLSRHRSFGTCVLVGNTTLQDLKLQVGAQRRHSKASPGPCHFCGSQNPRPAPYLTGRSRMNYRSMGDATRISPR